MNLDELRLRALQSLKRPFFATETENITTTETPPVIELNTILTLPATDDLIVKDTTVTNTLTPDKEEGELTDASYSGSEAEQGEIENDSNSSNEYHQKYNNTNNNRFGYSTKPRNTTWTRNGYRSNNPKYLSYESDPEIMEITDKFDLDSLINCKINLLSKIDETQSILAASEEKEHDLMGELQECRNLQKKCEKEKFELERKLEKIEKRIDLKEKISLDLDKEVSTNNFKKNFVGKMMKETYMRSFGDRFRTSSLFRMYSETLKMDPKSFNRIDPMTPFCSVELIDGKCPYYLNGTCSLQHIEEVMKKSNAS